MGRVDEGAEVITICTWLWGDKFSINDVAKLAAGVHRNLDQGHRFLCFVDRPGLPQIEGVTQRVMPNEPLFSIRGCYARLRMFSPEFQRSVGIEDRLACIDLDTVITGALDALFDRPEPFVIMQKGNASNPCPYNGALMMLRAGAHPEVWSDFSVEAASKVPHFEFPDDQGWLWHKIPNAAGWKCGPDSGVYVFRKPGWPGYASKAGDIDDRLPSGARLVTFSGWRSPDKFKHLDWVKENWR